MGERERTAARRRDKLRKQGRPSMVLPGEMAAARRLIDRARAYGMDDMMISRQVGIVGRTTVWKVRTGRSATIRRCTYEKIMRLRPEEPRSVPHPARGKVAAGPQVPAVGLIRRVRALRADGFTNEVIAGLMGVTPEAVSELARRDRAVAFETTHREVVEVYQKLVGARPADYAITPRAEKYTRGVARKRNWAPSACWDPDTLDDPGAHPEWTGACGTAEGIRIHRREGIPVCAYCRTVCATAWVDDFDPARLRALRTKKGLSLRWIAGELGYAYRTVQTWESGERTPTWGKIEPVLLLLDATIEDVTKEET